MVAMAFCGCVMATPSVSSSSSHCGASPACASKLLMVAGKSAWRNCTADKLTAMVMGVNPLASHCANWVVAVRNTHSPIVNIRPLRSAIGMNSAGDTAPSSGWVQRSSASAPTRAPLINENWGW